MGVGELFVLSTALGMDLFSIAIPLGMQHIGRKVIVKASFVFAVFHIVMLLSGYYIGNLLGTFVDKIGANSGISTLMMENCASIIGASVLIGLGLLMIKEGLADEAAEKKRSSDILQGWALFVLAFSVSVDALAAGFSFGMLEVDLISLNIILGIVIFLIAYLGLSVGKNLGSFLGERSTLLGGIALAVFGGHILWRLLA